MAITYPEHYSQTNAAFGNSGIDVGEIWYGNGIWDPPLWDVALPIDPNMAGCGMWEKTATAMDLSSYAYQAGIDDTGLGYNYASQLNWGKYSGGGTAEDWENLIAKVDERTSWIWGDVYTGLGIVRSDNTHFYFLGTYGLYNNGADGEKIVATASNTFTIDMLKDGAFTWYVNVTSHTPYTGAFYGDGLGVYIEWASYGSGGITTHRFETVELGGIWPHIQYNTNTGVTGIAACMDDDWIVTSIGGKLPEQVTNLNSIGSPYGGVGAAAYYPDMSAGAGWTLGKGGLDNIDINIGTDADSTPAGDAGGDGSYDLTSDPVSVPTADQFSTDALDTGLFRIYTPTKNDLQDFASWIYSDDLLSWLERKIKFLLADPIDLIISLNMAHFTPTWGGASNIVFAGKESEIYCDYIDKQMHHIDCGTIDLNEQTKSFQDYNDFSKIHIYLPYCGIHQISTNECQGGTIGVEYWIDCCTGSCVAYVTIKRYRENHVDESELDSVMYSFTGNCFQQVPLLARDFTQTLQGLMNIAGACATVAIPAAGAAMTTGGIMGAAGAAAIAGAPMAAKTAPSTMNSMLNMSPTVNRIGNFGNNFGYMQMQKPYLILERPVASTPSTYEERYGRPLYDYKKIEDCYGYCEIDVDTLWVDKFDFITSEEEDMLKSVISKGIYINHDEAYYNYMP